MERQFLQQLDHLAEALRDRCERKKLPILCGFSLLYLVSTCLLASRKLMWNDELFTLYLSRLPGLSDIWSALATGADQIPPFFHIITRASFYLFGVNHLSIRLPEILGFWLMSLCLFQFVSRRSSALYGFAAMLFPLVTKAYFYAYEARPYGLVLGFSGLALLCWQSAAERRCRKLSLIGLATSFAAAVSTHYYAVLLLFPLALGEVARSLSRRRLDVPIWVAFGAAMTPLLLFLPLIERARTYSGTFWAQVHWRSIPEFYYFLLTSALLPVLIILLVPPFYSTIHATRPVPRNQGSRPSPPFYEIAAAFGFIALPVAAVVLALLITNAFTHRYALPAVIGFSILIAVAASRLSEGRAILGAALVLSLGAGFTTLEVRNFQNTIAVSRGLAKTYKLLQSEKESALPIVASDAHTFMMIAYYAPRDIASRLVYLADPEASFRHLGHTALDRGLLDLKPWFGLNIEEYGSYVASRRTFLVYAHVGYLDGQIANFNWLLSELPLANRRIELRRRNEGELLFLVSPKEQSEDVQFHTAPP